MTFNGIADKYNMDAEELWDIITEDPRKERFFNSRLPGRDFRDEIDSITVHAIEEIMTKQDKTIENPKMQKVKKEEKAEVVEDTVEEIPSYVKRDENGELIACPPEEKENNNKNVSAKAGGGMSFYNKLQTTKEHIAVNSKKENLNNNENNESEDMNMDENLELEVKVEKELLDEKINNDVSKDPKPKTRRKKTEPKDTLDIETDIDEVPGVILRKFYAENFSIKPEKIFYMDDEMVKETVGNKFIVIEKDESYLFIKRTAGVISVRK